VRQLGIPAAFAERDREPQIHQSPRRHEKLNDSCR
jgi:hypothetical protein